MRKKFLAVIICSGISVVVNAQSVVVKDYGNTIPLNKYFNVPKATQKVASKSTIKETLENIFPIESSIPRKVVSKKQFRKTSIPNPIALIGADNTSLKWVMHNRKKLKEVGATVIVIDVETEATYVKLRRVFQERLGLIASYGDSKEFEAFTDGYPVLINKNGGLYQ